MTLIFPKTIESKAGEKVILREAEEKDALSLIEYLNEVITETDFLSRGKGEFKLTEEDEKKVIRKHKDTINSIFLIAEISDKIAGILNFQGGDRLRTRHIGHFGVSVLKTYWQSGVGRALVESLIEWAKEGGVIQKINLEVRTDNETAIQLYEKLGFEREGTIKKSMLIDGRFHDNHVMGLIID